MGFLFGDFSAYLVDFSGSWTPPDYWDADDIALEMSEHPNVWTDGGREDFSSVGLFEVAGAGVYLPASGIVFDCSVWRTAEEYGDAGLERCRAFMPVPGVMQTVQRAEFWSAIVAMQAYWPCHLGIDNLNVARTIGRLLDRGCLNKPLPLIKDGDLVDLVQFLIRTRGRETVRVTMVKGHADDADVQSGRVRLMDQLGNAEAEAAADLGCRHQSEVLIDARRRLHNARSYWYPFMLDVHRFMIAVAKVSVNHDGRGGIANYLLVWDQGSRRKVRRTDIRVNVDLASLPGPPGFLGGPWIQVHGEALPLPWFSGLAIFLDLVETSGVSPQGLLDAYIATIPKSDGDSTPLGQRPLGMLPVVCRLLASLRLGLLREWVDEWLPESVFSLGNCVGF